MKKRKWLAAAAALLCLQLASPVSANPRTRGKLTGAFLPDVDQIGYLTDTKKEAFVSTGGAPAETFDLVDATTGATVYTGRLSEQKHDEEAGEELQTADFTDFHTPGTYKLKVGNR